jgi:hypothetical protein
MGMAMGQTLTRMVMGVEGAREEEEASAGATSE